MENNILALAKKFITIKSVAANSDGLREILDMAAKELAGYTIEHFEQNGVRSILVYKGSVRPEKFKIILNGHLDIIPGKDHQYEPMVKNGRLYGAGSMDMKANVACLISVFKEIADDLPYPLGLQLVTDEEIGGFNGTKYQIEQGVRSEFVIAAEPTNFDIVHEAKGILQLKISATGKTAHSAYPWKGENAVRRMAEFLDLLYKKYPVLKKEKWVTTVNVADIKTGNSALNKIPDTCEVWLDVRFVPDEKQTIKKKVLKLIPKGFTAEVLAFEPPMQTDKRDPYVALLRETAGKVLKKSGRLRGANGSSDARHFAAVRCPGVEFGPIGNGIGGDEEWVDIKSLEVYCSMLKKFLTSVK